jgi:hypothetical protein
MKTVIFNFSFDLLFPSNPLSVRPLFKELFPPSLDFHETSNFLSLGIPYMKAFFCSIESTVMSTLDKELDIGISSPISQSHNNVAGEILNSKDFYDVLNPFCRARKMANIFQSFFITNL